MHRPAAVTSLLVLCAAAPAWSQTPPRPAPTTPAAEPESYLGTHRIPPLEPVSCGEAFSLAGSGALIGLLGGLGGAVVGIPAGVLGSGEGFWGFTYVGYSLATATAVWGLGNLSNRHEGSFLVTALGAVGGAAIGWSLQFWLIEPSDPATVGEVVMTALLSTTGAVTAYVLSAADIPSYARRQAQTRLVPTALPLRDGLVLRLGGTF